MLAVTSAAASGLALIASTTCLAVELGAPLASVARKASISLPLTAMLSGRLLPVWVAELGHDLVAAVLAVVLGGQHDRASRTREPDLGWTLNVKSPRSPWKPETS